MNLHQCKDVLLEVFNLTALLPGCIAVLLIEAWGLKKIWKLVKR